jgi:RNA polymerase sporulation-specific sigma factor
MQIKERLVGENMKEPTVDDIAKDMGLPKSEVVLALEAIVEPLSLYEPAYSDGGDTIFVMDQVGDKNGDKDWLDELSLKEAIKNLGEREKKILSLRFFVGRTQMEVAQEIGITYYKKQYNFTRRADGYKGLWNAVFEVEAVLVP